MTIPLENQINTILTPIFGNEIYPIAHPDIIGDADSVTNMFGIWSIVGGKSINKLEGDDPISRVRVQISIYSEPENYNQLKELQRAVSDAMLAANTLASQCVDTQIDQFEVEGALSNVSNSVPNEGREEDTRRFYSQVDYYCWARG
jgi:hypothetical protein